MAADALFKSAMLNVAIVIAMNYGSRGVLGRAAGSELARADGQAACADRHGVGVTGCKVAVSHSHFDSFAFEGDARLSVIPLPVTVVQRQAARTGKHQTGALQVAALQAGCTARCGSVERDA